MKCVLSERRCMRRTSTGGRVTKDYLEELRKVE